MNIILLFLNSLLVLLVSIVYINSSTFLTPNSNPDNIDTCSSLSDPCVNTKTNVKYVFYEVNPPEGFNLRRDVYLRLAVMMKKFSERELQHDRHWKLVLPPFQRLYHWRSSKPSEAFPWSLFFDINSLKSFCPVIELHEVVELEKNITFDNIYMLRHFEDAFESGYFVEKWQIDNNSSCEYSGNFWGLKNVEVRDIKCVNFLGTASKLTEVISRNVSDKMIMFTNAEVALHDEYGTSLYWEGRKSMRFNTTLVQKAANFIETYLNCTKQKCDNYLGVHWRRRDFAAGRKKYVPSNKGTSQQIFNALDQHPHLKMVFIASDASPDEREKLLQLLSTLNISVVSFIARDGDIDGNVAIIDQIICSRAGYFIGTHESTFTYRIQEEREINGFESDSTFNRFCPDTGPCELPSKWRIVE